MTPITNEVLAERIENLNVALQVGFEENKKGHDVLRQAIETVGERHGERLRALEDWKLIFVTKYTVFSAIALFLGSILSTVAYQIISKNL